MNEKLEWLSKNMPEGTSLVDIPLTYWLLRYDGRTMYIGGYDDVGLAPLCCLIWNDMTPEEQGCVVNPWCASEVFGVYQESRA